jgi:hypothetical protein
LAFDRREIPRFARNDKINYFFRRLFSLSVLPSVEAAVTKRRQAEARPTKSHLVSAEVFVGEAFEPLAEFFAGGFFKDSAGNFRDLQDFVFHKDGAIDAHGHRQRAPIDAAANDSSQSLRCAKEVAIPIRAMKMD